MVHGGLKNFKGVCDQSVPKVPGYDLQCGVPRDTSWLDETPGAQADEAE